MRNARASHVCTQLSAMSSSFQFNKYLRSLHPWEPCFIIKMQMHRCLPEPVSLQEERGAKCQIARRHRELPRPTCPAQTQFRVPSERDSELHEWFSQKPPLNSCKVNTATRCIRSPSALTHIRHRSEPRGPSNRGRKRSSSDSAPGWAPPASCVSPGGARPLLTWFFGGRRCADLRLRSDLWGWWGRGWWSFDWGRGLRGLKSFFRVRTPDGERGGGRNRGQAGAGGGRCWVALALPPDPPGGSGLLPT